MVAGMKDSYCSTEDTTELHEILSNKNKEVTLTHVMDANHQDLIVGKSLKHIQETVIPALEKHNFLVEPPKEEKSAKSKKKSKKAKKKKELSIFD